MKKVSKLEVIMTMFSMSICCGFTAGIFVVGITNNDELAGIAAVLGFIIMMIYLLSRKINYKNKKQSLLKLQTN